MYTRIYDTWQEFKNNLSQLEHNSISIDETVTRIKISNLALYANLRLDNLYHNFSREYDHSEYSEAINYSLSNYSEKNFPIKNLFDMILWEIDKNSLRNLVQNSSHWSYSQLEEEIQFRLNNELYYSHVLYILLNKYFIKKNIISFEERLSFLKSRFGMLITDSRRLFSQSIENIIYNKDYIHKLTVNSDSKREKIILLYGTPENKKYLWEMSENRYWYLPETTFAYLKGKEIKTFSVKEKEMLTAFMEKYNIYNFVPNVLRDKYISSCKKCNIPVFKAEQKMSLDLCQKCIKEILPTEYVINEYSTRAPDILGFKENKKDSSGMFESLKVIKKDNYTFEGTRNTNLYFGIEIELESAVKNDKIEEEALVLYEAMKGDTEQDKFILCKHDGSLNNGLEIITCPATFTQQKERLKTLFEAIKTTTLRPEATCGIHIHVSKDAISGFQLGKIMEFINKKDNRDFITKVAGREKSSYAKFVDEVSVVSAAPEEISKYSKDRYSAVNLSNKHTIEFRIFASTNDYYNMMHKLEFLKALIDYTRTGQISVVSLKESTNVNNFIFFVKENRKEYPSLHEFLIAIGKITVKPKPSPEVLFKYHNQERK